MTAVRVCDARFRYRNNSNDTLHRFTTSFGPGVHGIIGPNGAGKSTLLRILAGVLQPTSGSVTVDGETHARYGYLGHRSALSETLTVADNLRYWTQVAEIQKSAVDSAIATALDRLDLDGIAEQSVSTLSRGQRQRVALARVLLTDPHVVVLDEPFANVDPPTRGLIARLLLRIATDVNTTVIVSSHDLDQIESIASTILVLDAGHVVLHQSLEDILVTSPRTESIVEFVSVPGFASFVEHDLHLTLITRSESGASCSIKVQTRNAVADVVEASVHRGFPLYRVDPGQALSALLEHRNLDD
nr:ABC transporter ATP-binding protein [Rhodococcus fascians]